MRYLILGVTEARDEQGGALPLGGMRLRALLAALALRPGRSVPIAELVDDVWADDPPADAPAALQALVGRLRRALGRDTLTSTPGGYRLAAGPDDVDLHVFERLARQGAAELTSGAPEDAARTLRTALALWRGPALADLPDRDHALRPQAHRLAALERRIEADLRCAGAGPPAGTTTVAGTPPATPSPSAAPPAALVPELMELTAAHPYDERFRAQLIRALRAAGRQADALAAYEDARRALAEGLGTDPGPELTALHRGLLAPASFAPGPAGTEPARGNLRPRLTSFVGREPELRTIRDDLTRSRLVTLTGPGGSGKTRLAEESAAHEGRAAAGDVWLAELAPVEAPEAVPGAVLSALGLRETALLRDSGHEGTYPRTDPVDLLADHLAHCSRSRPFLLILDNCEHVIDAAAALAETLLTRCPRLRILATSREPLGVPGEAVRPVDPLPADFAHRLFTERARAVRPEFDPEREAAHDPHAVAEICRRLDGLPLAIELAAARLRMLGPRQIADRLDDRFRLLTGGSRTVLPRQQTLRAVVDWSWDLLDEDERTALRQVSVFAGGWDLPAAEAVITTTADTADLIGALIDKSLVVATPVDGGGMRYRLLETIHEYAIERCAETPGVRAAAGRAHTAHFLALVEEADPRLRSADQLPWIQRLETDLDNIRAALHRSTALAGPSDTSDTSDMSDPSAPSGPSDFPGPSQPPQPSESDAVRLVLGMGWFWWLRNYRTEGLIWTARALAFGPEPTDRTDPRYWPWMNLRMLRFFLEMESRPSDADRDDDHDTRAALASRVADAFASSGPQAARFPGLLWPMTTFFSPGVPDRRKKIDAVVGNARIHGGAWEYGVALMFRTHMVVDMPGGMPGVDADLAELRALSRLVGDRWMRAQVASAAAEAGMMRGRYDEARAAYEEALLLAREVGAHTEAPFLLARLAELFYRTDDPAAADQLLERSESEAERYQTHDATAYVHYLRATMALERGDIPTARRMHAAAKAENGIGSPPSHFTAILEGLSARITIHEPGPGSGPAAGLRGLTAALVSARDALCAEIVTGRLADGVVTVLPEVGRHAAAVRILAAADSWRLSGPRTAAEQSEVDAAGQLARKVLGARQYEEEHAAGRVLTVDNVIDLLMDITAELPPPEGAAH
ncbi:BTAD domain-containing putative transcriptional regulator [Streptomyces sp. NBC_01285]|uniref:ATP-binding protein n=1 Tax=Streptomyces sp. NBC_01285 TaxID=2903813 RepID=UPI002254DD7A|nr:BTAD domain-containing putative transcriptional regulator [Streptomyces sp. NBC_01285]MCX4771028.1 AAA family ATPase [Streptomyces sp. NBC_01285]